MKLYRDQDADLSLLQERRIAVIGYGNQGRAQALNLRDSGLEVLVGNREDDYAGLVRKDGLPVFSIGEAAAQADLLMLLVPDEVAPEVFEREVAPHLAEGDALVFASGYNVAFGFIALPSHADVVLVAPRMIGAGVRDLYVAGRGFPSFIGVAQDYSGQAKAIALALAKGIGSTRMGAVEVTFAQEAELDLFTEQCFGPAFGHILTTAVDLLVEEGYPPEAVLLELYMSGEFSYTLAKIAEVGLVEQSALHSTTSQYGSMSRGMRFILPELRTKMRDGLDEIRSGRFAQEWAEEQAAGSPTLEVLKEAARSLPLHQMELELRQALGDTPGLEPVRFQERPEPFKATVSVPDARTDSSIPVPPVPLSPPVQPEKAGLLHRGLDRLRRLRGRSRAKPGSPPGTEVLSTAQMEQVLRRFLAQATDDPALRDFGAGRRFTMHYVLSEPDLEFYIGFGDGAVSTGLGAPASPAEVRLEAKTEVLDGMLTGRINAMRAAMTGKLTFSGDAKLAISVQQIQEDLKRLYSKAREGGLAGRA